MRQNKEYKQNIVLKITFSLALAFQYKTRKTNYLKKTRNKIEVRV